MNRENRFVVLLSMMVVLALLTACGPSQPTATRAPTSEPPVIPTDTPPAPADTGEGITVTFEGGECVYHGPERVPAGEISIVLDVRDQTAHELYGVQTLTLDEGHTLDELVPYQQEISFPLWAHDHGFIEAAQGSTQARTIVLFEGPLFLSCFTNTADETQPEYAGILDPIEIEPAASSDGAQATPPAEPAGITVTFEGDQCVYHGLESLPAGRIPIVLDVRDQTAYEWYGVGAATVDEGKTLEDLVAAPFDSHAPDWVHDQAFVEAAQGDSQETTLTLFEGPLFLICATSDGKTNVLGPTEIEPLKKKAEPTTAAESGDSTWDMVVLGDSLVADDYSVLPEAYAALIEEDLGVEVEIQNLAVGGETTQSLLTNVQKYPWYREPLQEAEVILISVGGGDLPHMEKRFFGGEPGDCGGADNQDCLRQQLEESQADWDALLAQISSLVDPRETLIRPIIPGVFEYFARVYKAHPEDVDVYNSYVVALYEHMARSCAERGIAVLDLYALYDGPNADPSLPEIAGTGDGVHVSDEGDAVIADLLHELGYDPIAPAEANAGITVTFEGDQCIYHGPERVPAGEIPIVLDARDQTAHELYGVQTLTMDEDHTLEELVPYQQEIRFPLWLHDHGFIEAAQGTTQERTIVLFEGPLFLTCFTNIADETQTEYAGILGPIEVEPVVSQ